MFKKDDKTYYDWIDYAYDMKEVKNLEFDHVVGIYRGSLGMATHISNVFDVYDPPTKSYNERLATIQKAKLNQANVQQELI